MQLKFTESDFTYQPAVQGSDPNHNVLVRIFRLKLILYLLLDCGKNENKHKTKNKNPLPRDMGTCIRSCLKADEANLSKLYNLKL